MKKILVAIDESENALKAVGFAGRLFAGAGDVQITLFYVLPDFPPTFWDDGHILNDAEKAARQEVIGKWQINQQRKIEPLFKNAIKRLENSGFNKDLIITKWIVETLDVVSDGILEEARTGDYQMLVMGRHGFSKTKRLIMGSVTNAVINRGSGLSICIVE